MILFWDATPKLTLNFGKNSTRIFVDTTFKSKLCNISIFKILNNVANNIIY